MSSAPEHPAATGPAGLSAAGGEPSGSSGGADPGVLGVIAEMQGKLSALGKAHEERLKRDEAALAERIRHAGALEMRLAAERTKLDNDRQAAAELRERLDAQRAALDEQLAAAAADRAKAQELAAAVEGANKDLGQREAGLGRREAELAERETKMKAAEAQSKDRERKSQEAAARAAAATAEAANDAAVRAAEAIAATERADAAEAELQRLRTETDRTLADESRMLRAQLDEAAARADDAQARAQAAQGEAESLREQLAAATAGAARADQASAASLNAGAAELEAKVASMGEQIAKRDQAIDLLRARLSEAGERASAQATGPRGAGSSVQVRRQRLTRYRQLVQNEARKIVAAKNVLAKRQAECEAVIAQRAKLVQQAHALATREAKLGSRRSLVEATAGVCFAVGTVLLVAVLSWGVVSQIFPATYLATAVVSAETRGSGREPDLASWQNYHEQLVSDPRLMEETADRMARRGIESLSNAAQLAARLREDLLVTSDKPGMMRLELRGKGAERTARELETFATALVAVANTARESRADGAASMQSTPAASGTEPVDDQRLVYAAGFTAGGTGLAAIIGLLAWTQLSRAKRRYEAAGVVED